MGVRVRRIGSGAPPTGDTPAGAGGAYIGRRASPGTVRPTKRPDASRSATAQELAERPAQDATDDA